MEMRNFRGSAQNSSFCRKLWFLTIVDYRVDVINMNLWPVFFVAVNAVGVIV